jgi:hypothetical protein
MDRFEEAVGSFPADPDCTRCKDWGKVLVTKDDPAYRYVEICPECGGTNA